MFEFRDFILVLLSCVVTPVIALCIYRVTFHSYAKYPGPFLAKVTSLRGAYYAYTGNIHLDIDRCHKKYGNFVRYCPNSLLVNSPDGFHDIYGDRKKVKKSKSYIVHGKTNLVGLQDKVQYARYKRVFQHGFSDTANREHEPQLIHGIATFIEKLAENELPEESTNRWTRPKNMALWCTYLTTDVVCNVIFSTSWNLLTSSANRGITETFKTVTRLAGILHYWPHLAYHEFSALVFLPHLAWSITALRKYALAVMRDSQAAREKDPSINDVYGYFGSATDPRTGQLLLTPVDVRRNTSNFIIAGSDTTASSIAAMFFYLTHNPTAYAKVAREVRAAFPSVSSIKSGPTLNGCFYLRAAINESLRMAPVACQPLWRETEIGGCLVEGDLIPSGLNVGAGIFSLHHNAEVFPDPYKFDIERWIPHPDKDEAMEKERIKNMSKCFAPFSTGPRQCIAKNFAMMEIMLTMANVFFQLDFENVGSVGEGNESLGPGRDREGEFQMKSYFTSYMEGPMVRFTRRKS